jgi:nitrate reductase cytochrome c-type subunit
MIKHSNLIRSFVVIVVLALCGVGASASEKTKDRLAQQHIKAGVKCNQCHGIKIPAKPAKATQFPTLATKETCLKCHGSYKELAAKTVGIAPWEENPHSSHFGELECYVCHRVHQESQYFCTSCHIELKLPAGFKKAKNPADE